MAHPVLRTLATLASGLAAVAHAQSIPTPGEVPSYNKARTYTESDGGEMIPTPAPDSGGVAYEPLAPIPADQLALDGMGPAVTESTGTWLRRGLWYADLDAVIMGRVWDSTGQRLIVEYDSSINQILGQVQPIQFSNSVITQSETLGDSSPGYDGSARLALGRFLFRDQENRDHTAEFVVFGGSELDEQLAAQQQNFLAEGNGLILQFGGPQTGLHVPREIDGSGPTDLDFFNSFNSFDRARAMQIEYASRFHSWELNYNVAQRMRKDRMELLPSGEWIRRASPGFTYDYTAGFRYFDVEERLDWTAQDIMSVDETNGNTDGSYLTRTSNNLFGIQFGAGMTYESDRWNVTLSTKQGAAINDARSTEDLRFVDPDGDASIALSNFSTVLHENSLSYLATGSLLARYHLRPNLSLRAGAECMFITGLSLAPNEVDFNPAQAQLTTTGDVFYYGVTFGTEYYW